jgi:hypothetical protein
VACDRPAFDSGGKDWVFAGSRFKIWQFLNRKLARRYQLWLVRDAFNKAMGRIGLSRSMKSVESALELAGELRS